MIKRHTFHFFIFVWTLLIPAFFLPACDLHLGEEDDRAGHDRAAHEKHQPSDHEEDDHAGHDHAAHEEHQPSDHEEDDHAGHDHAAHAHAAGEDLDKRIEELFAAECEHAKKTYICDECRYEVGVVKVPHDLIEEGLVKVGKVAPRNFDTEIPLIGEIAFDERKVAHISPRVKGVVTRVKVDLGDSVKPWQALVVLESVELAEAQASYLESLAELALAKKAFERQRILQEQNITSKREFLEAEQSFEAAKIRQNAARQKLLRLGLSSSAIARLKRDKMAAATGALTVRAPFEGEILQLHAVRGERIDAGFEMILLGDTRSLWVWVDLYESQLSSVKRALNGEGLPVSLSVRSYPGERFSGKLNFVSRVMDKRTRTVKARIRIDNPDGLLKPGMFANVSLGLNAKGGNPALPETAVLSDDGRDFVFVHHEGEYFVRRPVTVGRRSEGFVELLDGVETGRTIAVSGAFLLKSDVLRSKMGEGCAH